MHLLGAAGDKGHMKMKMLELWSLFVVCWCLTRTPPQHTPRQTWCAAPWMVRQGVSWQLSWQTPWHLSQEQGVCILHNCWPSTSLSAQIRNISSFELHRYLSNITHGHDRPNGKTSKWMRYERLMIHDYYLSLNLKMSRMMYPKYLSFYHEVYSSSYSVFQDRFQFSSQNILDINKSIGLAIKVIFWQVCLMVKKCKLFQTCTSFIIPMQ